VSATAHGVGCEGGSAARPLSPTSQIPFENARTRTTVLEQLLERGDERDVIALKDALGRRSGGKSSRD